VLSFLPFITVLPQKIFEVEGEAMGRSCNDIAESLKQCIKNTACYQEDGHTIKECIKMDTGECQVVNLQKLCFVRGGGYLLNVPLPSLLFPLPFLSPCTLGCVQYATTPPLITHLPFILPSHPFSFLFPLHSFLPFRLSYLPFHSSLSFIPAILAFLFPLFFPPHEKHSL
jgi:hypothetical protein